MTNFLAAYMPNPETRNKILLSGAAVAATGIALYYCAIPPPLPSQSGKPPKSFISLLSKIRNGLVFAFFSYPDDGEFPQVHYWGKFRDMRQLGTHYCPWSKEWSTTFRTIERIQIGAERRPVPPAIIQGLSDGTLVIDDVTDRIKLSTKPPVAATHELLLTSQSSHPYCSNIKETAEPATPEVASGNLVTMAGAHHQHRQRIVGGLAPSLSSFDMSSTLNDTNSREADVKSLVQKYNDSLRNHFASHSGVLISQFNGIQDTMKDIKVLVPGPGGSLQEELRSVPLSTISEDSANMVDEDSSGV